MVVTVFSSAPMMMMTGPMAMCLQMFTVYPGVTLRPEATLISSRHRVLPFFGIGAMLGSNKRPGAGAANWCQYNTRGLDSGGRHPLHQHRQGGRGADQA